MPKKFDRLGVSFQYPDNWTLDDSDAVSGRESITVYSPAGPFWSLAIHDGTVDLDGLAQEAVDVIEKEYSQLGVEVEPLREEVLGVELVGYEMHFFYLDLTTTAEIRCFHMADKSYAVFCQGDDRSFDPLSRVFQAMTISLIAGLKQVPIGGSN